MIGSGQLYLSILRRIIGPTEDLTFLDLCCGEMAQTRHLKFRDSLHVDVKDWPERPPEFRFIRLDVREFVQVQVMGFDVCLCSDGIEHLQKEDGVALIENMALVARLPIIFTPLGDHRIVPGSTDPDDHKSGWLPEEFEARGWKTDVYPDWHRESPKWNCGAFFAWRPS